ncbi:hypothetical protein CAEBREN_19545 [Caenorhabditis brenneri]|uniref:Uncharacterized protein n=1 Tax=Caenorhabditis brenneri TaxID=135651 RepID=G0PEJ4_CAEBE|nr:hypothetical protein CAEBREN_19545 [Caenorhabditis brenneri]
MSIPPEVQSNGGRRFHNPAAKVVADTESLYRGTSLKEGNGTDNRYPFDEYKDATRGQFVPTIQLNIFRKVSSNQRLTAKEIAKLMDSVYQGPLYELKGIDHMVLQMTLVPMTLKYQVQQIRKISPKQLHLQHCIGFRTMHNTF